MPPKHLTRTQQRLVDRELEKLRLRAEFTAEKICHAGQLRMANDRSRNVEVRAGRQSGKTFEAVREDVDDALSMRDTAFVYVSSTKPSVKKMAWRPLKSMLRKYGLTDAFRLNHTELTAECVETGSVIYFMSADDEKTADRIRGIPRLYRVQIDEGQRYESETLRYLVEEVVRPGLRPMAGCLWILRTGTAPVGYVYEITQNPAFSHHHFTYLDNDKLGQTRDEIEAIVEEDLRAAGRTRDSAWFKREYLAEDVHEIAERIYKFTQANIVAEIPDDLDTYAICGDTGVKDADALALLGWKTGDPHVYLVREHIRAGQDVDDLDVVLTSWLIYDPILITLDGGANMKTIVTLQRRHQNVPLTAAIKPPVNQQVRELNTFLEAGILCCLATSTFAQEVVRPTWVNGIVNGKIQENGHSDIVPALRYGCLAIRPLLPEVAAAPKDAEEQRKEAILERVRRAQRKRLRPKWDQHNREAEEDLTSEYADLLGTDEF